MILLLEEWLKKSIKSGERNSKGGENMSRPKSMKNLVPTLNKNKHKSDIDLWWEKD